MPIARLSGFGGLVGTYLLLAGCGGDFQTTIFATDHHWRRGSVTSVVIQDGIA